MNARLQSIVENFQLVDPGDKLALLVEYAERLPPLPPELQRAVDAGVGRVHECETPIFVFPAVRNGRVFVYAWAPDQSVTPRAFASLLIEAVDGGTPEDVQELPDASALVRLLGVEQKIVPRRQVGIQGLIDRLKHGVALAAAP